MISLRDIADECDGYDAEIEVINERRKDFWAQVREVLPARDVKALKAAIKARRKRKADLDGEEAYEARVFEILAEIERGTDVAREDTRARAPREAMERALSGWRARENRDPPHNPTTGELLEPARVVPAAGDAVLRASTGSLASQAASPTLSGSGFKAGARRPPEP